ncbi:DUF4178 domain-containing protein [Mycolicibacterium holsaticum]|uniref:DUF4178 domain-containing protein n=1 Tax=Mycolicibacterium holsaticum TaxID=152142 RepID=UPI001C7E1A6E|nr:DUF4178 domain-containing protein [Mycolicibacterium holsaticum]MDA4110420.1 hypothetical protein [Mycolicibacterium holsaticum DSM 44478 = JCM 12374]QZA11004.1 DUF4178 domain-containing protein [Mycolicibacterium holsaticum DSM 44478 = JCM 12374]UNC11501.1 DUF4178 domain-containing protein [Mycolicibacterium holsaticum DSM 44478 = JCM 12374]
MDTLLIVLAIIMLAGAIIVLVVALRRPKKSETDTGRQDPLKFAATMPQFGPRQLGPGAIVSHGGVDYVVRGSVTLRQGPFVWWEHLLEGGSEPLWFSVEEDEGRLELVMWQRRKDVTPEPNGTLQVNGVSYRQTERGRASFTTEGTTGLPAGGEMEFVDYADAEETSFLGFERWAADMPWEVSVGKQVLPGEFTVYPAPPPNA